MQGYEQKRWQEAASRAESMSKEQGQLKIQQERPEGQWNLGSEVEEWELGGAELEREEMARCGKVLVR